jgi:stearoyl-CoA desaturase (delta-9 desaturase)
VQTSRVGWKEFRVRWPVLGAYLVVHAGALLAPFYFTWSALIVFFLLTVVTAMLGITVGYHRMLTHKSFETYPWVRRLHATFGALALELGPLTWVRLHRAHHAYSDQWQDPHAQSPGFFYGHIGWSFLSHKTLGRSELAKKIPKDLASDPYLVFLDRYFFHLVVLSLVALYLVGGMPWLVWGGFLRIVWTLHCTWFVNSATHRWGSKPFVTKDNSRNLWWVAVLAWGEGWHNNHHKFPNSARHGILPGQIDLTWIYLGLLKKLGLAWNFKLPADEAPPAVGPRLENFGKSFPLVSELVVDAEGQSVQAVFASKDFARKV